MYIGLFLIFKILYCPGYGINVTSIIKESSQRSHSLQKSLTMSSLHDENLDAYFGDKCLHR